MEVVTGSGKRSDPGKSWSNDRNFSVPVAFTGNNVIRLMENDSAVM